MVLGEPPVDLETGAIGKTDVEQQDSWRCRLDERRHLVGALRLTDELDALHLFDRCRQPQPEHRMVVDDRDTNWFVRVAHGSVTGSRTWMWVPWGASRVT